MKDAEPKAKHPKQENRIEMSTDGPEDGRGQREDSDERQRAVRETENKGHRPNAGSPAASKAT